MICNTQFIFLMMMKFAISASRKLNSFRNNRWVKLSLFLILMIGMVWQVYRINTLYLKFDTVVDIQVDRQFLIQLPAFTICLDIDLYNLEPLKAIFPKQVISENLTAHERYLLYRSASIDQLYRYTTIMDDVTISCLLICSQDSRFANKSTCVDVPCDDYSPRRESIEWSRNNALRRCYTYFMWGSSEPYLEALNGERDFINFNLSRAGLVPATAIFTMHSGSYVPWTEDEDFSSFNIGLMSIVSINYQLTQIKLLQAPYRTDCQYYSQFGISGWVGCMYDCKKRINERDFKGWPLDVPGQYDVNLPFVSEEIRMNDSHLTHKINRECHLECEKKQCNFNDYSHYIKYVQYNLGGAESPSVPGGGIGGDQPPTLTRVYIHRPFHFDIVYKHRPAIDFIEYFSYVGSAIGLWFGFSCLTLFNFTEKFLKKFIYGKSPSSSSSPSRTNSNTKASSLPEIQPPSPLPAETLTTKRQRTIGNNGVVTPKRMKKRPPNIRLSPPRVNNLISPISTNLSPTYNKSIFNETPDDVTRYNANGPLTG